MSDNFDISPGTGVTIGSKDIGSGVQAQRILPVHGSGTDSTSTTPFPVYQPGNNINIEITPVVSTSPAYTAGDAIGGKQTLTSATRSSSGSAILRSLLIYDLSNQKADISFVLFNADPSTATITDNTALNLSTDRSKVIGQFAIGASDWISINSEAICQVPASKLGQLLTASGSANLYAALMAVGISGVPTYSSTSALRLVWGFDQRN